MTLQYMNWKHVTLFIASLWCLNGSASVGPIGVALYIVESGEDR